MGSGTETLTGQKYFDPTEIQRWSRIFQETARLLDSRAEQTRPESVDAGPFALVVQDMVEATVAQYVHLILTLQAAADKLSHVAAAYRAAEERNAREFLFYGPFVTKEIADAWRSGGEQTRTGE